MTIKFVITPKGQRDLSSLNSKRSSLKRGGDLSRFVLLREVNKPANGITILALASAIRRTHPRKGMPISISRKMVSLARQRGLIRAI